MSEWSKELDLRSSVRKHSWVRIPLDATANWCNGNTFFIKGKKKTVRFCHSPHASWRSGSALGS